LLFTLDSPELDNKIAAKYQSKEEIIKLSFDSEDYNWLCLEIRNLIFSKFPEFCSVALQPPSSILRKGRTDITLMDIFQNPEIFESLLQFTKPEDRSSLLLFRDISIFRQIIESEERFKLAEDILKKYPSSFLPSERDDILHAIESKMVSESIFDPIYIYIRSSIQQKCDDFIEEFLEKEVQPGVGSKKGVLSKIKITATKLKKSTQKSRSSHYPKKFEQVSRKYHHITDLIKNETELPQDFIKFLGPMESDLYFFKDLWEYTIGLDTKIVKVDVAELSKKTKTFTATGIGSAIDMSSTTKKKLSNEIASIEAVISSKSIPIELLIILRHSLEQIIQQQYINHQLL